MFHPVTNRTRHSSGVLSSYRIEPRNLPYLSLVPDTALPTLDILAELEESLGKPVLTANQVTLWQAFHLAGAPPPPTLGCLSRLELSRA